MRIVGAVALAAYLIVVTFRWIAAFDDVFRDPISAVCRTGLARGRIVTTRRGLQLTTAAFDPIQLPNDRIQSLVVMDAMILFVTDRGGFFVGREDLTEIVANRLADAFATDRVIVKRPPQG